MFVNVYEYLLNRIVLSLCKLSLTAKRHSGFYTRLRGLDMWRHASVVF